MGEDKGKKGPAGAGPRFSKWSFRLVVTAILALMAWYAGQHNVTAEQFNEAFASIPIAAIILAMFFDYGLDTGKLYDRIIRKPNSRMLGLIYSMIATGVFFLAFIWLITGNLQAASAASVLSAGLVALLVFMPNTGTSEWILWLWVAETLVTAGKFLTILPGVH